jgi:SAM-dependent methyltransferase
VSGDVASAYAGNAAAWDAGPERLYEVLARAIVATSPVPLAGWHMLDAGAGTGAASVALHEAGARVTAIDVAADMVATLQAKGFDAVAGDLLALPFDDGVFDGDLAAFSISHLDDPTAALVEARRVVRAGGVVLAGVFAAQAVNTSKDAVDSVAEAFGLVRPRWYEAFKRDLEPRTNTSARLWRCAELAGLADIRMHEQVVDTGIAAPADIVASRIGMAHLAPFVASLPPSRREQFVAAAVAAVARDPEPLRPAILVLSSRVRG